MEVKDGGNEKRQEVVEETESQREKEPSPALTVTTVVVPAVLYDRHPAQNIRTPPVGVAKHHVEEVWRADRHRHQHFGLTEDRRAMAAGKRKEGLGGKTESDNRVEEKDRERQEGGDDEEKEEV